MHNYTVIQTLNLKDDSQSIYTMINLPVLSYKKNRHYFCTGDENHILIWKSNKKPKNINIPECDDKDNQNEENSDNLLSFSSEGNDKIIMIFTFALD